MLEQRQNSIAYGVQVRIASFTLGAKLPSLSTDGQ